MSQRTGHVLTARELECALDVPELVAVYQPCYDLRTGSLVAVEALARLRDPRTGDLIQPALFIPTAEASGLVTRLDLMMIEQAFRQVALWRSTTAGRDLCVAVNLSPPDLDDPAIAGHIRELARDAGLPIDAVVIELTETMLADADRGHDAALAAISALGCNVTLDDFGTGNASFAYLQHFDAQGLKIDRSFVQMLVEGGARQRVAESLVRFCLSLDVHVVAEGIEEPSQVAALRRLGCHFGQGFLLGRPMLADDIDEAVLSGTIDLTGHRGDIDDQPRTTSVPAPRARRSRTPLLAALVVLIVASLAGLTVSGQRHAEASLRNAALDRLVTIDSLAADDIDQSVDQISETIADSAGRANVRRAVATGDQELLEDEVARILAAPSEIFSASLYDASGTLLALHPEAPGVIGKSFAFRDWYDGARRTRGRPYVSTAFQLLIPEKPWAIAVAAAVRDSAGRPIGYAVATYVLSRMQAELAVALARHGVSATLVDEHGTVLAAPDGSGLGAQATDPRLLAMTTSSGDPALGRQWSVRPVPALGGWLLAEQDGGPAAADADSSRTQTAGVVGLLAIGAIGLVLLWARSDRRRRRLQAGLRAAHCWLTTVLASTPTPLVVCDAAGRVQSANGAMAALLGTTPSELEGADVGIWLPLEGRPRDRSGAVSTSVVTSAGDLRSVEVRTRLLDDPEGKPMHLHTVVDVTDHRLERDRLHAQGRTDALTGVGNRRALREALAAAIDDAGSSYRIVMMDLDGFKSVNDTLGHAVGDELLVAVAATLRDAVRPGDTVARVGGDEFVVVVRVADDATADLVAGRLQDQVIATLHAHSASRSVGVGVSAGTAIVGRDGSDIDELLFAADQRMYVAKRAARAARNA